MINHLKKGKPSYLACESPVLEFFFLCRCPEDSVVMTLEDQSNRILQWQKIQNVSAISLSTVWFVFILKMLV